MFLCPCGTEWQHQVFDFETSVPGKPGLGTGDKQIVSPVLVIKKCNVIDLDSAS